MDELKMKCGFVAVLGLANAGKSTLVNQMVGSKITIVTPKAQTTRNRIMGIYVDGPSQVILMDTPGIFKPKRALDRAMVASAWSALPDSDIALLLVDVTDRNQEDAKAILVKLLETEKRIILVFNKIDKIPAHVLLPIIDEWKDIGDVEKIFMISALNASGVDDLKKYLNTEIPLGHWQFPEDQLSDLPVKLLASEITREQVFFQLDQELPYQIAVVTESWETRPDGSAEIHQVLFVERDGQKGIVLGNKGARIKAIGSRARREIRNVLGHPVHLYLHVKVNPKWSESREYFGELGLTID